MNSTKVVKFGGSSLADANQFKKVAEIIHADKNRRFVVASAPGKRFDADVKVTDMLYACYEKASKGEKFEKEFGFIEERYNGIINDLNLDISLEEEFKYIKASFAHSAGRDYAASRGEYLNSILLAKYLGFEFIDTVGLIYFNESGEFDLERTISTLGPRLAEVEYAVIPGFYGSMPNDTIKTFSRGGSDVTGSIVSRAVEADIYENWTDVSGFLICDPRIVKNPEAITTITYKELRELSYMGATVLHEDAIFPVRTVGIPINIKNTNKPEDAGTMIVAQTVDSCPNVITGIAGKKGFSVINIEKDMMNSEVGFGRNVLRSLEKQGICFEHIPSGIDTLGVVVSTDSLKGKEKAVLDEIISRTNPDHIEIENNLALIAVVGRGMKKARGTAAKIFTALAQAKINIKMIDQGSSELNIIVGVEEEDFEEAIRAIYNIFVQ
ncbi:aspartate kinase [Anaerobium acetethylicum]|uniref:Aspartokinase n=1 Tax=Anaerobium acetethylicum TaxID=1619234 RepID=A0A1D3TNA1_9FIRM|nr:aspartate kinase [Anaerobium acetethylicum]SCP94753.1 aspartate kinase [Anaerobium acetethylicum]